MAALGDIIHMKVLRSVRFKRHRFVFLKTAGAGDPLVGDLDGLGAGGVLEGFGVGIGVGA